MIINDPRNGRGANVNQYHQLEVAAVASSLINNGSQRGRAFFTWLTNNPYTTVTTTGGYMFVFNNAGTRKIVLSRIIGTFSGASIVWMYRNMDIGTIGNANTGLVSNINFGSNYPPGADIYAWNGTGDGITGITNGDAVSPLFVPAGAVVDIDYKDSVLIPPGSVMGLNVKGLGASISLQMLISFLEIDEATE